MGEKKEPDTPDLGRILLEGWAALPEEADTRAAEPAWISGVEGTALAVRILHGARRHPGRLWVVTPGEREAEALYDDLLLLNGGTRGGLWHFADTGVSPWDAVSPSPRLRADRMAALTALLGEERGLWVAGARALSRKIIHPDDLRKSLRRIAPDEGVPREGWLEALRHAGYRLVAQVENVGEMAVRGEVVDFFPSTSRDGVRLGFFDDDLEDIRRFDPVTQKTTGTCAEALLPPVHEAFTAPADRAAASRTVPEAHRDLFEGFGEFPGAESWIHAIRGRSATATAYGRPGDRVILVDPASIRKTAELFFREADQIRADRRRKVGELPPTEERLASTWTPPVGSTMTVDPVRSEEDERGVRYALPPRIQPKGNLDAFRDEVRGAIARGERVVVTTGAREQKDRLESLFQDVAGPRFTVAEFPLQSGLRLPGLVFVADHEIFGRARRRHRHFAAQDANRVLESFLDLQEGDTVVHINHGVAVYRGLERRTVNQRTLDYLSLEYAKGSKLLVPVDQMHLVQRHLGGAGRTGLDELGGKAWDKVKNRVKAAVVEIAHELVALYGERRSRRKRPYRADSRYQADFEAAFEFEETPDQLAAATAIKNDMESERPMDRLVCGDVGFGKTEVAVRAMFKAALEGRQTAMLVPTTILADQHARNLRRRLRDFPVRAEALHRFQTPAEQKKILAETAEGKVDILVGTHRLLSKDVTFKDLGLFVIDEEQKFGVKHKEKIRERARLVDTLTLTATPIPRTLHMSMANLRDISVIATPPVDRLPVETYVTGFSETLVEDAVRREIDRGGQVFFVHNRIETMAPTAVWLRDLTGVPEIGVAHGQMEEHVLEEAMEKFIAGETRILVATSIIDSGLDIPNANTLFVHHAQDFGLAQLHQMRGRVGRSDRTAYAYFFYPEDRSLGENAVARLNALADLTALGSGLKVALRDLDIRGAGSLLGAEQSGHVMAVGFEMYCRLLDEAVETLKGVEPVQETVVDVRYDGYLPDRFAADSRTKIEIYKRMASIRSREEADAVRAELEDRFGQAPEVVHRLLDLALLRVEGRARGVLSIQEKVNRVDIKLDPAKPVAMEKLLLAQRAGAVQILPQDGGLLSVAIDNTAPHETDRTSFEEKVEKIRTALAAVQGLP